jgi:hypothetical protein
MRDPRFRGDIRHATSLRIRCPPIRAVNPRTGAGAGLGLGPRSTGFEIPARRV